MDYTTKRELYLGLQPVFEVKQRLIQYYHKSISNENIWQYLINTKWKNSYNLKLCEVVNDIVAVEINKIIRYIGD